MTSEFILTVDNRQIGSHLWYWTGTRYTIRRELAARYPTREAAVAELDRTYISADVTEIMTDETAYLYDMYVGELS